MPEARAAYQQLIDDLVAQIRAGTLKPLEKIPSGTALCERYGVSRQVVRQATDILKARGILYGIGGSGVYVAERAVELLPPLG